MKTKYAISLVALAAVLGTSSFAWAADTNSFAASVSVLSPDQTGFLIGGQVAVNGVGVGALTMTRSKARMIVTGSAESALDVTADPTIGAPFWPAINDGVNSLANITSSLDFDRSITTSGSLAGMGSVTSRGEAIAAIGSAGAASATTTTAGTRNDIESNSTGSLKGTSGTSDAFIAGGAGNANAEASAQGSLNGSLSTSNTLQLLGSSGLFAGQNGTTVGEASTALAYGSSDVMADGTTGIDLTSAVSASGTTASGNGGLFELASALTGNSINMNVANAGNGSVSITSSTGGFFTGGGAAGGTASLSDTDSFFGGSYTLTVN